MSISEYLGLFPPVNNIPLALHTNLHLHATRMTRTNGRSLGIFKKEISGGNADTVGVMAMRKIRMRCQSLAPQPPKQNPDDYVKLLSVLRYH